MLHKPLWQILNISFSESTIQKSNKIISIKHCRELRTVSSGVSSPYDLLKAISSWKSKRKRMHQWNSSRKLTLFLILIFLYNFFPLFFPAKWSKGKENTFLIISLSFYSTTSKHTVMETVETQTLSDKSGNSWSMNIAIGGRIRTVHLVNPVERIIHTQKNQEIERLDSISIEDWYNTWNPVHERKWIVQIHSTVLKTLVPLCPHNLTAEKFLSTEAQKLSE